MNDSFGPAAAAPGMSASSPVARIAFWGALGVAWTGLLYLFNLWPGHARELASRLLELGIVECFARQGLSGGLVCESMGYPAGYHVAFGLPILLAKAAIVGARGMASLTSDTLVDAAFLGVGLLGAVALLRHLGVGRWLALFGAYLYLSSPVVYGQEGYGAMRIAFVLVPTYVWLDQRFLRGLVDRAMSVSALVSLGALVVAMRVFALFMDGYSFVMSILMSLALMLPWLWSHLRAKQVRAVLAATVLFGTSVLAAYGAYRAYFPGSGDFPVMEIDFFRGQGVDLYALAVPSPRFLAAFETGWAHTITASQAYTDGPPLFDTYLGWSLVVGVVLTLVLYARGRCRLGPALLMVMATGGVALILSLGPSLKIADFRKPGVFNMTSPYLNYVMPAEAATFDLGTGWIYQHVPGIDVMRALYRWHVLVRLALIATALVGLQACLGTRRGVTIVCLLCAAAFVELFPNVDATSVKGLRAYRSLERLQADVANPLAASLLPGDRVLVQPCLRDTPRNDWMASYLCGRAGVRCYNAGGDKSLAAAMRAWPAEVRQTTSRQADILANITVLFDKGQLDAVAFTPFGLWEQAYSWPMTAAQIERGDRACSAMLGPAARAMQGGRPLVLRADGFRSVAASLESAVAVQ